MLHTMELGDQITKFVRKQPVASFGLAVGVGALIGILVARR